MRGIYVGDSGLAYRASQIYVGVNGVARRVKKGYVGVGGVARIFLWVADRAADMDGYYGYAHGVARVGGYVLFINNTETEQKTFYAYNSSLVRTTGATGSNTLQPKAAVTQNANYAIIAGGEDSEENVYRQVLAVNGSLVVSRAANMATPRYDAVAGEIGNYAVVGGGYGADTWSMNSVEAYNLSLARTSAPVLGFYGVRDTDAAAAAGGTRLIYCCGRDGQTTAYSPSLARIYGPTIGRIGTPMYGVSRSDYAVFGNQSRAYALTGTLAVHGSIDMSAQFRGTARGRHWAAAEGAAKSLVAMGDRNIGIDDNLLTSRLADSDFRDHPDYARYMEYSAGYVNGNFIINGGSIGAFRSFKTVFTVKEV